MKDCQYKLKQFKYDESSQKVNTLIEKPEPNEAPSNLAIASRYIFRPEIFEYLKRTPRGKNNEIQLTDAMVTMLGDHAMYGLQLKEKRFDIGNKLDFLETKIEFGLQSPDISADLAAFLKQAVDDIES